MLRMMVKATKPVMSRQLAGGGGANPNGTTGGMDNL